MTIYRIFQSNIKCMLLGGTHAKWLIPTFADDEIPNKMLAGIYRFGAADRFTDWGKFLSSQSLETADHRKSFLPHAEEHLRFSYQIERTACSDAPTMPVTLGGVNYWFSIERISAKN